MVMIDLGREGDTLFRHLQCSQGCVLTPREVTKVPRQCFRSPLYPTEAAESATVQYPLLCIALLSKIYNDLLYSLLCSLQFHSCSRRNAQHSTSIRSKVLHHVCQMCFLIDAGVYAFSASFCCLFRKHFAGGGTYIASSHLLS